tara:strand:- start:877 stop:1413 length:537 start_codon:yes stop_codon:yes gene_type:complete
MIEQQKHSLQYIKANSVCAEVGVWEGELSSFILKRQPAKLHLIDPWQTQDVIDRLYSINQEKMDRVYENVSNRFGKLSNVEIHREFSTNVSFPIEYFDWVYIDADHSYDAVKKDLEFYYPLMKKGAYLCGDDYGLWHPKPKTGAGSDAGGGPKPAVDEFVSKYNLKLKVFKDQFVIFL